MGGRHDGDLWMTPNQQPQKKKNQFITSSIAESWLHKGLDHTTNFSTNAIGYCVVGDDRQCSTTTANHLDDSRWSSTTRTWQRRSTTTTENNSKETINSQRVLTSIDNDVARPWRWRRRLDAQQIHLPTWKHVDTIFNPLFCTPLHRKPHRVCCVGTALLPSPCPPQLLTLPVLRVFDVQAMHGVVWSSMEKAWSGWRCFWVLSNKRPWQTLDRCSECEGVCYRENSRIWVLDTT